ncbi:transmembrane protein 223 [Plutella xylostella]|uniref:transmembrane protein 223 n=1 Tax=Plutella xylostella TaxID=51655 RepID=UPI002032F716|nr:transmembrane protein 223 [Plutella xylostella]
MSLISYASSIIRKSIPFRYPITCKDCCNANNIRKCTNSVSPKPLHEVRTNVANDVVLFKYENPKYFKYMNLFAAVQYMFWAYIGAFAFTSLKDAPVDESKITAETPWFRKINMGEPKYKNTLGTAAVVVGGASLGIIWMYTLKSVRFLILNKGGKHVTFVTYSPFGQNRMMKVPLENVCCKESRATAKVQLPIKVKNTWMHYMLDMRGEFKNPTLFDSTAGLFRKI